MSDRYCRLLILLVVLVVTGVVQVSGQLHKSAGELAPAPQKDPLGSATVSFGSWMTPLDRFTEAPPPSANHHVLTPNVATIKAGGSVNFIISGLHVVAVYDDGTQPSDIDTSILVPGPRPGPPIIDDSDGRIYRGIDPVVIQADGTPVFLLDRVEVVNFSEPGLYLVLCAVLPHFQDGMWGYVRVLPN